MSDAVIETFHYEVEERADGWWTRFVYPEEDRTLDWVGPYPSEDAANEAVKASLEQIVTDFTKKALGLS